MNPSIGLFGKLPSAGDFVAHNAGAPVAQSFQRWLQDEVDQLAQRGRTLPPYPLRVMHRDPNGTGVFFGTFAPSQDAVGRHFPLAIFAYVDTPVACQLFPSLPAAYGRFLDGAANLLYNVGNAKFELLVAHAQNLLLPGPLDIQAAQMWTHETLHATRANTLLDALFGPRDRGVQFHGVNMFVTACSQVRGAHATTDATVILECPASDDVQQAFWLKLAHGLLQWQHAPPSFIWAQPGTPESRLLLALGAPGPGTLSFMADPEAKAERLWPLRTIAPAAVETGRRALSTARVEALTFPPLTALQLLQQLLLG